MPLQVASLLLVEMPFGLGGPWQRVDRFQTLEHLMPLGPAKLLFIAGTVVHWSKSFATLSVTWTDLSSLCPWGETFRIIWKQYVVGGQLALIPQCSVAPCRKYNVSFLGLTISTKFHTTPIKFRLLWLMVLAPGCRGPAPNPGLPAKTVRDVRRRMTEDLFHRALSSRLLRLTLQGPLEGARDDVVVLRHLQWVPVLRGRYDYRATPSATWASVLVSHSSVRLDTPLSESTDLGGFDGSHQVTDALSGALRRSSNQEVRFSLKASYWPKPRSKGMLRGPVRRQQRSSQEGKPVGQ